MFITALALTAVLGGTPPPADSVVDVNSITYEQFMSYTARDRKPLFRKASPSKKAELMTTQLDRSLESYASVLTAEQRAVALEMRSHLSADYYDNNSAKGAEDREAVKLLEPKLATLFDKDLGRQLFTIDGEAPLPKK
jgi:hypothetical protein